MPRLILAIEIPDADPAKDDPEAFAFDLLEGAHVLVVDGSWSLHRAIWDRPS